jgi:hypothetical protein
MHLKVYLKLKKTLKKPKKPLGWVLKKTGFFPTLSGSEVDF